MWPRPRPRGPGHARPFWGHSHCPPAAGSERRGQGLGKSSSSQGRGDSMTSPSCVQVLTDRQSFYPTSASRWREPLHPVRTLPAKRTARPLPCPGRGSSPVRGSPGSSQHADSDPLGLGHVRLTPAGPRDPTLSPKPHEAGAGTVVPVGAPLPLCASDLEWSQRTVGAR